MPWRCWQPHKKLLQKQRPYSCSAMREVLTLQIRYLHSLMWTFPNRFVISVVSSSERQRWQNGWETPFPIIGCAGVAERRYRMKTGLSGLQFWIIGLEKQGKNITSDTSQAGQGNQIARNACGVGRLPSFPASRLQAFLRKCLKSPPLDVWSSIQSTRSVLSRCIIPSTEREQEKMASFSSSRILSASVLGAFSFFFCLQSVAANVLTQIDYSKWETNRLVNIIYHRHRAKRNLTILQEMEGKYVSHFRFLWT